MIDEPDFEWLMIDARHCKVHPDAAGARGGQQGMGRTGLNSKVPLAVDAQGMPVRVLVTSGSTADCPQALALIESIDAQFLLADRGYDRDEIRDKVRRSGGEAVIPPRRNRKEPRA